jgi:dTDP-D-glucose 4,6-dehydratase
MLAIKKAKMLLGWEPFYTSEEAIYQTIDWYKHARKSPLEYTLKQIDSFFAEQ